MRYAREQRGKEQIMLKTRLLIILAVAMAALWPVHVFAFGGEGSLPAVAGAGDGVWEC